MRLRTTLAATALVGLAMLLGAFVLVGVLRDSLTREVRTATRLRVDDAVTLLEASAEPDTVEIDDADDLFVQVLDEDGEIVSASPEASGVPPVTEVEPGDSKTIEVPTDDDEYLTVAATADTRAGPRTVIAGRTLEVVGEATGTVVGVLAVGLPVLLALVALVTWLVVGRALGPVDRMRREVDEISAAELHRRVPEPTVDDEIGRLARTMNRMLERLEQAQARQRRFVSDASHELRSPVASIRQHAEVALAHPDRSSLADLAENVLAEDLRVQQLVDDLLVLARADERTDGRRRPVDLDDLVFEEARRLREMTELQVDTSEVSAGRVEGNAAALTRVLRNLGDNAARHARSKVAFRLAAADRAVVLAVDDDGPGVPEADRSRVFERFVRLDEARDRDAGGSGLGLAIVSALVEGHDGTVTVADSPLGGARLEITLPAPPFSTQ